MPYVEAESIPEAYFKTIRLFEDHRINSIDHLVTEIYEPLTKTPLPIWSLNLPRDYEKILNFGGKGEYISFHDKYKTTELEGQTGDEKILDRIRTLCPLNHEIIELEEEVRQIEKQAGEIQELKKKENFKFLPIKDYKSLPKERINRIYYTRITKYGCYEGRLY